MPQPTRRRWPTDYMSRHSNHQSYVELELGPYHLRPNRNQVYNPADSWLPCKWRPFRPSAIVQFTLAQPRRVRAWNSLGKILCSFRARLEVESAKYHFTWRRYSALKLGNYQHTPFESTLTKWRFAAKPEGIRQWTDLVCNLDPSEKPRKLDSSRPVQMWKLFSFQIG